MAGIALVVVSAHNVAQDGGASAVSTALDCAALLLFGLLTLGLVVRIARRT